MSCSNWTPISADGTASSSFGERSGRLSDDGLARHGLQSDGVPEFCGVAKGPSETVRLDGRRLPAWRPPRLPSSATWRSVSSTPSPRRQMVDDVPAFVGWGRTGTDGREERRGLDRRGRRRPPRPRRDRRAPSRSALVPAIRARRHRIRPAPDPGEQPPRGQGHDRDRRRQGEQPATAKLSDGAGEG